VRVATHQLHKRGREEGIKKREKGYVCPLNILAQMFYFVNDDFAIEYSHESWGAMSFRPTGEILRLCKKIPHPYGDSE